MSKRRLRFQVKGLADDIQIVLIQDDPEADIGIEAGSALLDLWNLDRKP